MVSGSERLDVRRLRALLALLDVERDALALVERAVPAALDRRVVDEDVRSTTVRGGEAEPLLRVEPLHCSFGHSLLLAEAVHRGPAIAQSLPDTHDPSLSCLAMTPSGATDLVGNVPASVAAPRSPAGSATRRRRRQQEQAFPCELLGGLAGGGHGP